jgi:hypothetical protein
MNVQQLPAAVLPMSAFALCAESILRATCRSGEKGLHASAKDFPESLARGCGNV